MELGDNVNCPPADKGEQNPNSPQPPNLNTKIDEGLDTLRTFVDQLRGTREPRKVSLDTSLGVIVRSITSAQGEMASISKYRERIFEYFSIGLDRNQLRDLGISKQELLFIFRDPQNGQKLPLTKKCIYID
jgi:hypothetical protein